MMQQTHVRLWQAGLMTLQGEQCSLTLDVLRTATRAGMTPATLISVMPELGEMMLLKA